MSERETVLAMLRRLEREATAGPWEECACGLCGNVFGAKGEVFVHLIPSLEDVDPVSTAKVRLVDSALIASSRTHLAAMLEVAEALVPFVQDTRTLANPSLPADKWEVTARVTFGDLRRAKAALAALLKEVDTDGS